MTHTDKAFIQDFLRNYSIETTVHQAQRVDRFDRILRPGTHVYISHTPGTTPADMVALAARLRKEGMEPVPHVVARRIGSLQALGDFLGRLTGEGGVTQALLVAGDIPVHAGQLEDTLQILDSGLLEKHGIRMIGVAGYPEGHPALGQNVLRKALEQKKAYADRTGADIYVVTQFTFSAEPVVAWQSAHAEIIGRLRVVAGVPGLATIRTLLKYAMDCGIGASLEAFMKRYVSLSKLLTVSAPDDLIVALARHKQQQPQSLIAGIHFFPFGGFQKTADWANRIVAGKFEVTEDGGLNVN